MAIIGTAIQVVVQLLLSHLLKVLFFVLILGLRVLYMGAISYSMYFIAHIYLMWLLFVFGCAIFVLNLSFFEQLSYNEMTQCTCTDV